MIQGGDPTGTGKGGQSIWGKPFADEIRTTLKVCMITICVNFRQFTYPVQCSGSRSYGEFRPRFQQEPVFHRVWQTTTFRWQIYDIWQVGGVTITSAIGFPHLYRLIDGSDTLETMEKAPVNEKNRPLQEIKLLTVGVHFFDHSSIVGSISLNT